MSISEAAILQALARVVAADGATALTDAGALSPIAIDGGRVLISITADPARAAAWEAVRRNAEAAVRALPGVTTALVTLTAERPAAPTPAEAPTAPPAAAPKRPPSLAGVRHVIAVASGKGGVGKSTTACNLALAMQARGLTVGVLDADIYGPSMPRLFNLKGRPRVISGRLLAPLEAYGCKVMSIGFVVETDTAMIWRGPMVASAITQMLRDIAWGTLDVLVIDMPPGTGDAQLTLAQNAPLAGAVIVSTPQDLALLDARRGVAMFKNVGVPILGIVENMSYFLCDQCGKRHELFAHGGARDEAIKLGVPFLGEIALDPAIRARADDGVPIVVAEPESAQAKAYDAIADRMLTALGPEVRSPGAANATAPGRPPP
jgi:ATP-binding protein involved in chromosome partitioning